VTGIKHRCTSPRAEQGPRWCCVTVFPNHGIRGVISCMRSQKLDSMRSRHICEATGRRLAQNKSIVLRWIMGDLESQSTPPILFADKPQFETRSRLKG
jgi:hypothetical protein